MRFYNPKDYAFVNPYIQEQLPLEAMMGTLQAKQAAQDKAKLQVAGLKKDLEALPVDQREIAQKQALIDAEIDQFKEGMDLTDPSNARKLIEATNKIGRIYREADKVYGQRKKEVDQLNAQIDKTKDETHKAFLKKQVAAYYDRDKADTDYAAHWDEQKGAYNPVKELITGEWKTNYIDDINKIAQEVAKDSNYVFSKLPNLDEVNKAFREGKITTRDAEKIKAALLSIASSPDHVFTAAGLRNVYYNEDFEAAREQERNAFITKKAVGKDGKEHEVVELNPNSLLAQQFAAAIAGKTLREEDLNTQIYKDYKAAENIRAEADYETTSPAGTVGTSSITTDPNNPASILYDPTTKKFTFDRLIESTVAGDSDGIAKAARSMGVSTTDVAAYTNTVAKNPENRDTATIELMNKIVKNAVRTGGVVKTKDGHVDVEATVANVMNLSNSTSPTYIPGSNVLGEINKIGTEVGFNMAGSVNEEGLTLEDFKNANNAQNVSLGEFDFSGKEPRAVFSVTNSTQEGATTKKFRGSITNKTLEAAVKPMHNTVRSIHDYVNGNSKSTSERISSIEKSKPLKTIVTEMQKEDRYIKPIGVSNNPVSGTIDITFVSKSPDSTQPAEFSVVRYSTKTGEWEPQPVQDYIKEAGDEAMGTVFQKQKVRKKVSTN